MGKLTYIGLVPPDDPMFTGGVEFFSKSAVAPATPAARAQSHRVTINWEGDELQMDLDEDSWNSIQAGEELTLEELDENDELTYRWLFNVEPGHSLIVDFGDPNHLRWLGQLADADITEIKEG